MFWSFCWVFVLVEVVVGRVVGVSSVMLMVRMRRGWNIVWMCMVMLSYNGCSQVL